MRERMIAEAFGPRTLMGLGSTVPRCDYPAWCNWIGGADRLFDACRPLTGAELRACQAAEFGPAMTAAARQQAIEAGDQSVAAYLAMHPDEAAAYRAAVAGTDLDWAKYGLIAIAVLFGVALVARR